MSVKHQLLRLIYLSFVLWTNLAQLRANVGAPEAKSDPQNTGPIEVFVKMSSWLPRAGQEGPRDVQEVSRASQ